MKRTLFTLLALALMCTGTATAQNRGDREQNRAERIQRMAQRQAEDLKLDDATTTWFVNLYTEYEEQLSAVRKEAMKDMPKPEKKKESAEEEDFQMKEKEMKKLTDEQADKMIQANFDRTEKELQVKRIYYSKFQEKLTPKQLVRIFGQPGGGRGGNRGGGQRGGFGGPMGGPMGPRF